MGWNDGSDFDPTAPRDLRFGEWKHRHDVRFASHHTGRNAAGSYVYADSYAGSWARLYTRPTTYTAAKRLDRKYHLEGPESYLGRFDHGNRVFWQEDLTVTPPTLTLSADYTTSAGVCLDGWSGAVFPSVSSYQLARDLNKGPALFPPFQSDSALPGSAMIKFGGDGIAQTLPTVPQVSLSTTLGELREGLPRMVGAQLFKHPSFASLGDEYLNYQFGIAPLYRDVKDYLKATKTAEMQLRQIKRDSGKDVRRRRTLDSLYKYESGESSLVSNATPYPGSARTTYTVKPGVLRKAYSVSRVIWFSGAYRYRMAPSAYPFFNALADFNRKYGASPDALMAWNLTPWSWLVDWFANAGSVFANVSYLGRDGLFLRYGYVMCHTRVTETDTWTGPIRLYRGDSFRTYSTSVSRVSDVKQRIKASPFGFGLQLDALDGYQRAILTALGLSRLRM